MVRIPQHLEWKLVKCLLYIPVCIQYSLLLQILLFITTVVNADYEPISMTLGPYDDGNRVYCFQITIIDDPDPERNQIFFIDFVSSLPDSVSIRPRRVSVTILDNDCKLKFWNTTCN